MSQRGRFFLGHKNKNTPLKFTKTYDKIRKNERDDKN